MSGSLSLIIVLIVVVWAIVLAPMVFGDSKPIRRSGEGYDETRVLHQGGTAAVQARRRPKVTRADIHHFDAEDDYEVVEAEHDSLIDATPATPNGSTSWKKLFSRGEDTPEFEPVDGEVVEPADEDSLGVEGSTKVELPAETPDETSAEIADDTTEYDVDDSYFAPEDYGYVSADVVSIEADTDTEAVEETEPASEVDSVEDPIDDEVALARARRGRGGWDPEAAKRAREDRFRRRQRTFLGLIVVTCVAFVFALVSGGWAWLAPAVAAGLLVWYMVALRSLVKQERALHARRVRQLHRARLGVVSAEEGAPIPAHMRRPGAVILELDEEGADFANLPTYRSPQRHTDAQDTGSDTEDRYQHIA